MLRLYNHRDNSGKPKNFVSWLSAKSGLLSTDGVSFGNLYSQYYSMFAMR